MTYNFLESIDTGHTFEYYSLIEFSSIYPLVGTISGGTKVRLKTTEYQPSIKNFYCLFGKAPSEAVRINTNTFECISPSVNDIGIVKFSYSINQVDYSYTGFDFTYVNSAVIYDISPELGSINGGTLVEIQGVNFNSFEKWYCKFGVYFTIATVVSFEKISCVTPPNDVPSLSIEVEVYQIRNITLESFMLTDYMQDQLGTKALGYVLYTYELPVILLSVQPTVLFSSNLSKTINVSVKNLGVSSDISCVWFLENENLFLPAEKTSDVLLKCPTPSIQVIGDMEFTLTTNNFIETKSKLVLRFLPNPSVQEIIPSRILAESSTGITFLGNDFQLQSPSSSAVCIYKGYRMEDVKAPAQIISPQKAICPVSNLGSSREVQKITVSGLKPTSEIQVIDVTGIKNQTEIQRIRLSTWGANFPILKLRAGTNIPSASTAIYTISTDVTYKSEVQRIKIRPVAYINEIQTFSLNATVASMNEAYRATEDKGSFAITTSGWTSTVYWNSTAAEIKKAFSSNTNIYDVTVSKSVTSSILANSQIDIRIVWQLTFSPCDGNVPSFTMSSVSIPRSTSQPSTSYNTLTQGSRCECQMIDISRAAQGSLVLKYNTLSTIPIAFSVTPYDLSNIMIKYLDLENVQVSIKELTQSHRKWYITFINTPGNLPLLQATNVNSSPSPWGDAWVNIVELVSGQATALTGNVKFSSGGVVGSSFTLASSNTNPTTANIPNLISSSIGGSANAVTYDWMVTFSADIGDLPLIVVDTTSVVGASVVTVSEVVKGSGRDSQTFTITCPGSETFVSTSISISIGDHQNTSLPIASLSTASLITTALQSFNGILEDIFVTVTTSTNLVKEFTANFVNKKPNATKDGLLMLSSVRCTTNYATINVARSSIRSKSTLVDLDGKLVIKSGNSSISVPVNADNTTMANALYSCLLYTSDAADE